ncbi:MAG: c-type cytochrome [Actinobacteria bacterium]|nr:c-type cytochrome [Actinomycetota bacterium]
MSRANRRRAVAGPAVLVALAVALFSVLVWAVPAPAQPKGRPGARLEASAKLAAGTVATGTSGTLAVSSAPGTITAGQFLYDEHCEACHGPGAVGARAPELLDVGPAAVDFMLSTGRMPLNSITQQPLPGRPYFNKKEIAQIVAYINFVDRAHGTPGLGIPEVTPACKAETATCPTLSEGDQLFLLNCSQCHDASGAGGMLSHGYVVPSLRQATREQIAEAIRVGPRPMPGFGPGELTDQQVSAIADYVYYLGHSPNRGGFGIANFGPVPEGFVAIIFGLGLLVLVARLIGNRG